MFYSTFYPLTMALPSLILSDILNNMWYRKDKVMYLSLIKRVNGAGNSHTQVT